MSLNCMEHIGPADTYVHTTLGAGFYLNATSPKYSKYYNMLTHVTEELPQVLGQNNLPVVRICTNLTTVPIKHNAPILLPIGPFSEIDLRTLYGRAWCSYHLSQSSQPVPLLLGVLADRKPNKLPVGPESLLRIPPGRNRGGPWDIRCHGPDFKGFGPSADPR